MLLMNIILINIALVASVRTYQRFLAKNTLYFSKKSAIRLYDC